MKARWVKVDTGALQAIRYMPSADIGEGLKMAVRYGLTGEIDPDAEKNMAYCLFRDSIDMSEAEYLKTSARNKKRVSKRWSKDQENHTAGIPQDTAGYRIDKNILDKSRLEYDYVVSIDADAEGQKNAQSYITKVYPFLTPGNLEVASEWCAKYPADLIRHMVDITADKRCFRYLEKAMIRLEEEGLKTLDEVKAAEALREQSKRNLVGGAKPNPALQYDQRPADDAFAGFSFIDLSRPPDAGDV